MTFLTWFLLAVIILSGVASVWAICGPSDDELLQGKDKVIDLTRALSRRPHNN